MFNTIWSPEGVLRSLQQDACCPSSRHAGIDETFTEVVGYIKRIRVNAVAAWLDQLDITGRHDATRCLVVFNLLRDHTVAIVVNLYATCCGDYFRVLIVCQVVRTKEHLRSIGCFRRQG